MTLGFNMINPLLSLSEKVQRSWWEPRQLKLIRDSGLFEEAWYLSQNPDVVQAKIDPALHYLRYGGFEARDPSPKFSSAFYLDTYPDVKAARINPLVHYMLYGKNEGRQAQIPFKVFCISMQRTGTTSVGKFFRDFGFVWAGWPHSYRNNWSWLHYNGDYESIFSSDDFRRANAFEDAPWFFSEFYKILYHRFPNSKFILFTRDPDAWFLSMKKHSGGNVLGQTVVHCKNYRRELEYFRLLHEGKISFEDSLKLDGEKFMKLDGLDAHYKEIYELHRLEVVDFFNRTNPRALFTAKLEDPEKWVKLGSFLGIDVPSTYLVHENASH